MGDATEVPSEEADYALMWRDVDKVVYSTTLDEVWTPRTRLERAFDPEAVVRLKNTASRDISVSGPGLAHHAFRAGLVDELHLFVFPIVVGGGKPGLPRDVPLQLELIDQQRFESGVVHLHYRIV
jgi:dihydrofolate reductase